MTSNNTPFAFPPPPPPPPKAAPDVNAGNWGYPSNSRGNDRGRKRGRGFDSRSQNGWHARPPAVGQQNFTTPGPWMSHANGHQASYMPRPMGQQGSFPGSAGWKYANGPQTNYCGGVQVPPAFHQPSSYAGPANTGNSQIPQTGYGGFQPAKPFSWNQSAPTNGVQPTAFNPYGAISGMQVAPGTQHGFPQSYQYPQPLPGPRIASSFNALSAAPLPARPPAVKRGKKRRKIRNSNMLGLTPGDAESSEEEDVDEEAVLSVPQGDSQSLQVTFKGRTSTLGSAEDIAAWIAERRKKFPTKQRVEERKAADEENRKKVIEHGKFASKDPKGFKQARKADKKAKRSAQRKQKAAEAKKAAAAGEGNVQIQVEPHQDQSQPTEGIEVSNGVSQNQDSTPLETNGTLLEVPARSHLDSVSAVSHIEDEDPLASDSEGTDDADSPIEESALAAPRQGQRRSKSLPLCRIFLDKGECKRPKCKFRHGFDASDYPASCASISNDLKIFPPRSNILDRNPKQTQDDTSDSGGRKGLYSRMVEQEQEQERLQVVRTIKKLGDAGFLEVGEL